MAKKTTPKKSKKSDTETEDMPDVETEDMDDGDDEEIEEPDEAPPEEAPPEEPSPEGAGEPAKNPPPGSPTYDIKLKGDGTIPIVADGAMTRFERGKKIEVTKAQLDALKEAGEKFEDAK